MTRLLCSTHDRPRPCPGCLFELCDDLGVDVGDVSERAAILEYDGGLTREAAEREAVRWVEKARGGGR